MSLVVENLTKQYATPGQPLTVLADVSLALDPGESLSVVGPSGSGKSTLLSIVGTLERPTAGRVSLGGQDPFALTEPELAAFRRRHVGFVFQDHYLLPQCTALENVLVPTLGAGRTTNDDYERALELLRRVDLIDRQNFRPAELSGGQRQRVAIARALVQQPSLVLADEPTGNLDRSTADAVAEMLLELVEQRQAMLLLVTHSARLAERTRRRAELVEGKLLFS